MIFVMLAMGRGSVVPCSNNTRPESRSAKAAAAACTLGSSVEGGGVSSAVGYGDGEPSGGTGVGGGMLDEG